MNTPGKNYRVGGAYTGIIAFVPQQFIVRQDSVHLLRDNTISVKDVFAGAEWFPTATPAAQFGFCH